MNDTTIDQIEDEILTYEVSDALLEAAAAMVKDNAGSQTISFCSGLDTCPS